MGDISSHFMDITLAKFWLETSYWKDCCCYVRYLSFEVKAGKASWFRFADCNETAVDTPYSLRSRWMKAGSHCCLETASTVEVRENSAIGYQGSQRGCTIANMPPVWSEEGTHACIDQLSIAAFVEGRVWKKWGPATGYFGSW